MVTKCYRAGLFQLPRVKDEVDGHYYIYYAVLNQKNEIKDIKITNNYCGQQISNHSVNLLCKVLNATEQGSKALFSIFSSKTGNMTFLHQQRTKTTFEKHLYWFQNINIVGANFLYLLLPVRVKGIPSIVPHGVEGSPRFRR